MDLQHGASASAPVAVGAEDPPQVLERGVHGDEPVDPVGETTGRLGSQCGKQNVGRSLRPVPDPSAVDPSPRVVVDDFARVQASHDVEVLAEELLPFLLGWPGDSGHAFVAVLAAAECEPEALREHRCQSGGGLGGDDGW